MGSIIRAVGTYFPRQVITNADLEKILAASGRETNDEWIFSRTGIKRRRIASDSETVGSMALEAAKNAIASLKIGISPIEHIVVATNTSERPFPNSSSFVQDGLRRHFSEDIILPTAGFSDVYTGCGGINAALKYGDALVISGIHRTVLVIGADRMSYVTDYSDRQICILFEDGASADILSGSVKGAGFMGHCEYGDGSRRELIACTEGQKVDALEALRLVRESGEGEGGKPNMSHGRMLKMDGPAVFRYVSEIWDNVLGGLRENKQLNPEGIGYEDINWINAHLANFRCLAGKDRKYPEFLKKCGLDGSIEDFCNSSTASQGKRRKQFVEEAGPGEYNLGVGYGTGAYACVNLYKQPDLSLVGR